MSWRIPLHYISEHSLAHRLVRWPAHVQSFWTCAFSEEKCCNFASATTHDDRISTNYQSTFAITALPNRIRISLLSAEVSATRAFPWPASTQTVDVMLQQSITFVSSKSEVDSLSSSSMGDCVIGWGVGDMDEEHHIHHYPSGPCGDYSDARKAVYSTSRGMVRLYEAFRKSTVFPIRGQCGAGSMYEAIQCMLDAI